MPAWVAAAGNDLSDDAVPALVAALLETKLTHLYFSGVLATSPHPAGGMPHPHLPQ